MPIRDTQDAKLIVLVHLGGFEDKRCGRYRILDYRPGCFYIVDDTGFEPVTPAM